MHARAGVRLQAVLDAYLCLLHLTAGIFVEALFNTFATAAFFKFVVFSIFEMRYLLVIWKATADNAQRVPSAARIEGNGHRISLLVCT
jgi:hypothetical protein